MKNILSILLLTVFLFNVGGYYIFFWALRIHTDKQLTHRLDANLYRVDETIELKIPMTLPYPVASGDFERVEGKFEHKGQHYRLVKRKFQDDTLHVVCIRDHATRKLVSAMTTYIEASQGLESTGNSQKALDCLSKLMKDSYFDKMTGILYEASDTIVIHVAIKQSLLMQVDLPVHSPPPRS